MEPVTILVTGLGSIFGLYGSHICYKTWNAKKRKKQIEEVNNNINAAYGMPLLNIK